MDADQYQLMTLDEVLALTRMSKSTLHEKVRMGTFPRPVRLGPRMVRWLRWEVEAWIASRPVA